MGIRYRVFHESPVDFEQRLHKEYSCFLLHENLRSQARVQFLYYISCNYSPSIEVAMKLFTVNRIWSCDEKYRQISARNQNFDKGIYFGKKRLPPPGRRNKLNSKKRKQGKIQLQRKSKKLTMFMSFMDIFPVFYKFFPYFSSYLSNLTFCCTISC